MGASVELKDFVRQSPLEIAEGVHEANESHKAATRTNDNPFLLAPGKGEEKGTGIHFDVAITTRASTGMSGDAKVGIKVVEARTGGRRERARESVSRIKFTAMIRHYVG